MFTVLHDVPTSDLIAGDLVIRDNEDQIFVDRGPIDGSNYVEITWAERPDGRLTWTTTAESWNLWPIVVRHS